MTEALVYGLAGAALAGCGTYGLLTAADAFGRILGFNILGGGVFLIFGVIARRGAGGGFGGDPVPQGLIITGIVVAFCATALAVALLMRLRAATDAEDAAVNERETQP